MKLLTKTILSKLPNIGEQSHKELSEIILYAKFFTAWTHWTWFVSEYDPIEKVFFGYVQGFENEWGYFSLEELESVKGPFNMRVERDRFFEPIKFIDLK